MIVEESKKPDLKQIYQQYFDTVYRVCFLYMKNSADAQDMTQETFFRLLNSSFVFESEEKTKAWLIVTASNCCKSQLKKWWFRKRVEYEDGIVGEQSMQVNRDVYDAVMSLADKYSIPTYLYYFEGYRTGEIAGMLHVNQSTVQTRLAKARELLKLELSQEEE